MCCHMNFVYYNRMHCLHRRWAEHFCFCTFALSCPVSVSISVFNRRTEKVDFNHLHNGDFCSIPLINDIFCIYCCLFFANTNYHSFVHTDVLLIFIYAEIAKLKCAYCIISKRNSFQVELRTYSSMHVTNGDRVLFPL